MGSIVTVLAGIAVLFGVGLLFSAARGAFIAALISIGSGVYAYSEQSLFPLLIGFLLLWVLRLLGIEQR